MEENKVINLKQAKAKYAGIDPDLLDVIDQINNRFDIELDASDKRIKRLKEFYPILKRAVNQEHNFKLDNSRPDVQNAFAEGLKAGKAQLVTDIIIDLLEQDGLITKHK